MKPFESIPGYFINRELSWLEFNARVLEEAQDESNPLLERVKFLSIFSSNLDEFFMVRVAGLREQAFGASPPQDSNPDGLNAIDQLKRISVRSQELVAGQYQCLTESVLPALAEEGIEFIRGKAILQNKQLDTFFNETVFPIITPMAIDPSHPSPRFHNRGLYLAAMLRRSSGLGPKRLFAVVQLPQVLPRLVPVASKKGHRFVLLEDLIKSRLPELFGGFKVKTCTTFRITRDGDLEVLEQESDDMLRAIEERLRARRRADAVRLEIPADADEEIVSKLVEQEHLHDFGSGELKKYSEVYRVAGPVDLTGLLTLLALPRCESLRDPPFLPQPPQGLRRLGEDLFDAIARRDILLHHPYDSFAPVVEFVQRAAVDPKVVAVKQTLYRTSGDSPIINALIQAAEAGKHVTAIVELNARFDEEANVGWARKMEKAGVHVVYGFMDLKTHSKVSLVVRKEDSNLRCYVHLGTGNYNPNTALVYTDVGLFTANKAMADDVCALFNLLTGYSQGYDWKKLVVAPTDLQRRTIELIDEQTARAKKGKQASIFAKLNSLVDQDVIEALYTASQAGVPIDLIVRGVCCLRPGIEGLSESIHVKSIVDRFLEHSRIFVFGVSEEAKVFFSSADWMPRNFRRRVEVMFPIESPALKRRVLDEIIPTYLSDNIKARILQADGAYRRAEIDVNESSHISQETLLRIHKLAPLGDRVDAEQPTEEMAVEARKKSSGNGAVARKTKNK